MFSLFIPKAGQVDISIVFFLLVKIVVYLS
jgi:hypothetical protein